MKTSSSVNRATSGFTLVEIMFAATISVLVVGVALSTFIAGLRMMYKDTQRLANNSSLRSFLGHISKQSLDSTEFYLFPNYSSLDGSVNLSTTWPGSNLAQPLADTFGTSIAQGDCLVLVSRLTNSATANISWIRIYYRFSTSLGTKAPFRYYEKDCRGAAPAYPGTTTSIQTLLNGINLSSLNEGSYPATKETVTKLIDLTLGRQKTGPTDRYPIFSTEVPFPSQAQANVAVNLEVINGTSASNQLSSSSFNYIVSPRK